MPKLKHNADFVSERKKETVVGQMNDIRENLKEMRSATLRISREEFDLLSTTYKETIYYITEFDGTVTVKEGEF